MGDPFASILRASVVQGAEEEPQLCLVGIPEPPGWVGCLKQLQKQRLSLLPLQMWTSAWRTMAAASTPVSTLWGATSAAARRGFS